MYMWIIGYGSLMNQEQFVGKEHKLIRVNGWKRIFNKVVSRSVWKQYAHGNEVGTLNVIKSPDSYFNGVAYRVSDEEFSKLVKREEDYHIEKAEMYDFVTSKRIGEGILFVSNEINQKGEKIVRDNIRLIPKYLEVCRKGAYSWGEVFGKDFDRTTFLADGETNI